MTRIPMHRLDPDGRSLLRVNRHRLGGCFMFPLVARWRATTLELLRKLVVLASDLGLCGLDEGRIVSESAAFRATRMGSLRGTYAAY